MSPADFNELLHCSRALHLPLVWVLAFLIPISIALDWVDTDAR
jgi:hypothetical protein